MSLFRGDGSFRWRWATMVGGSAVLRCYHTNQHAAQRVTIYVTRDGWRHLTLYRFWRLALMSSLAGALLDVDMPTETTAAPYTKHDEEMGDLFGEDSNVDYVHHTWRSVLSQPLLPTLIFMPLYQPARTNRYQRRQVLRNRVTLPRFLHHPRTMVCPRLTGKEGRL